MKKLFSLLLLLLVSINFCNSKDLLDSPIESLTGFVEGYLSGSGLDEHTFSQTCVDGGGKISDQDFINSHRGVIKVCETWNGRRFIRIGPYNLSDNQITLDRIYLADVLAKMCELIENGQDIGKSIEIAEKIIKVEDRVVRDLSIPLFNTLVEGGYAYDEAIKAGLQLMTDEDPFVRFAVFKLFGVLLEKDEGLCEAMEVVRANVFHYDSEVRYSALFLFDKLRKKGVELDGIINLAKEVVDQKLWTLKSSVVRFYNLLFKEKSGIINSFIISLISYRDFGASYELLFRLAANKETFSVVFDIAKEEIKAKDFFLRSASLKLFKALLGNDLVFPEAIEAAKIGAKDKNKNVRYDSLSLFIALVNKGQGIEEAKEAVSYCVDDKDHNNRGLAKQLLEILDNNC